ncbi:MAG: DUF4337 domain-containing protein [Proteobacteria bacterium]|nr:DUF4337 domain-containing protein [Pseudomonadota bacterium]
MSGHAHVDPSNRKAAILIAVFAACLAIAETGAKSAQTHSLSANIEAANLWAFFQAKTVRQTTLRTAGEELEIVLDRTGEALPEAATKRIAAWRETIARWESEPDTQEGRRELAARAKAAEAVRDRAAAAYHHYELSSAAFQLAIVLMSAMVITGAAFLTLLSSGMALVGTFFGLVGFFVPQAFSV